MDTNFESHPKNSDFYLLKELKIVSNKRTKSIT